jgi:hypothetical protein
MPHMIDRHIITALHARWPEEFNKTSSHRFRTGEDMQFAFSYMYFMMRQVRGTPTLPADAPASVSPRRTTQPGRMDRTT